MSCQLAEGQEHAVSVSMVQGVDTKFEEDCLQILISFCVQIEGLFFSFFFSHSLKSSYLIYLKHLFFFLF